MEPQTQRRAWALFQAARELEAEEQARFVTEVCGADVALRREVESLLEAEAATPESFLEARPGAGAAHDTRHPALHAGSRLGPFEIVGSLGSGGMGEVYRAHDGRLGREVALKVLPAALAADPARCRRLAVEARAISALSHPNICALHDVGEAEDTHYLVFELVEGESLAQRLTRGPQPVDEALARGAEIAAALDAAHRRGICHRDLKPANVMLTRFGAKLLDFGLARMVAGEPVLAGRGAGDDRVAEPLTTPGMLVGTVPYMAPEQVDGRPTDARTDIFALGVVLHEMLTGESPFPGEAPPALAAADPERQPRRISAHRPDAPAALDRVVRKCLAGDPDDRWQSAADLADELSWIRRELGRAGSEDRASASSGRRAAAVLVAGGLVVAAALAGWSWARRTSTEEPSRPVTFTVDHDGSFDLGRAEAVNLAVAPSGDAIAFGAWRDGARRLWIRKLDDPVSREVPGSAGAENPFWSPDGRQLGFTIQDSVWIASRGGEPARKVLELDAGGGFFGPPSWSPDGTLVFSPASPERTGVYRAALDGGPAQRIVSPTDTPGFRFQAWPQHVRSDQFLFIAGGGPERAALFLGSTTGGAPRRLDGVSARTLWVDSGHLVYGYGTSLLARRFDPRQGRWLGEPILLAERLSGFGQAGGTQFGVARDLLAISQHEYVADLVWFDRRGDVLGRLGEPGDLYVPRLSPDGSRVAVQIADPRSALEDLWVFELPRGVGMRLTASLEFEEGRPVWSPDGRRLAFYSDRSGFPRVGVMNAEAGQPETPVAGEARVTFPYDWSPDGSVLVYSAYPEGDLWFAPLDGDEPRPFLRAPGAASNARFSPNGKLLAFDSSELGVPEVFVAPITNGNARRRISTDGGSHPAWRGDGRELYFLRGHSLFAVAVHEEAGTGLSFTEPRELFRVESGSPASFDVTRDGERFLISVVDEERAKPTLTVTVNWRAKLVER